MKTSSEPLYDDVEPAWKPIEGSGAWPFFKHRRALALLIVGLFGGGFTQLAMNCYASHRASSYTSSELRPVGDRAQLAYYRKRLLSDVVAPLEDQLQQIRVLRQHNDGDAIASRKPQIHAELDRILNGTTLMATPPPYQRQQRELQLVVSLSWESLSSLRAVTEPADKSAADYSLLWFKSAERQLNETKKFLSDFDRPI